MFSAYFELVILPNEVKAKNKIKIGANVPRLDCVRVAGYYKGIEPFVSKKGMIKFYLQKTKGLIHTADERRAGYCLQGEKSMNFSSIIEYFNPGFSGYASGEPNDKKLLSNGSPNPMYEYRNDGYLFICSLDFTKIELLVIENGRFLLQGYIKQLAAGEFDEAIMQMRETAKPFYEY